MLPAWIDSDLSLGKSPGKSAKEWEELSLSLFKTGATAVIDNTGMSPKDAQQFKTHLSSLFSASNMALKVHAIGDGTDPSTFDDIGKNKSSVVAVKTSMDQLNKKIAPPHKSVADRLFQIAGQEELIVIISLMHCADRHAAQKAVAHALELAEKYNTELCLQHIRTREELSLVRHAKQREMLVFAEVAYPHLFFTQEQLARQQSELTHIFLPTESDQASLWESINDGTIDMVGSGAHLPPSGHLPLASQLLLPLMLEACRQNKLRYEMLVELTRINIERIFRLPPSTDVVLVDMERSRPIPAENSGEPSLFSLLGNQALAGWPAYVISQGNVYQV